MSGGVNTNPLAGTQIGRQFWVSNDLSTFGQMMQATSGTNAQNNAPKLTPPDKSFVNFVRGGTGGQFGPAVNAAREELFQQRQVGGTVVPNEEQIARSRFNTIVGQGDFDRYVDDLTDRMIRNNAKYNGRDPVALKPIVREALIKTLNLSEVKEAIDALGNGGGSAQVSGQEWDNARNDRVAAVENAVTGLVELLESGQVSKESVLYLKESKVLCVNSIDDLSKVLSEAAKAAKETFLDQKNLDSIKSSIDSFLQTVDGDPTLYPAEDKAKIVKYANEAKAAVDALFAKRQAAVAHLKTEARTVDNQGRELSVRDKKKELQLLSNSTRAFRYSLDGHQKRTGGVMQRIRRFFSDITFRSSESKVSKQAFLDIREAENALTAALENLKVSSGYSEAVSDLRFDGVGKLSAEAGSLTHQANALLRNCSKKVDKSYVAYEARAHELFDKALKSSSSGPQTFTMTCKISADLAFDLGAGSGKAGIDIKREVAVIVHPGGKVSMGVMKGAGLHAEGSAPVLKAEAWGEYMQGNVLEFTSFDDFLSSAYGRLALPATDADRQMIEDDKSTAQKVAEKVVKKAAEKATGETVTKHEPKFLGDTSGNVAKRAFRTLGFMEFGTRVDTRRFLETLRQKGHLTNVTALVNGLDSGQRHVASAKEKRVAGGVSAEVGLSSDDESKSLGLEVGFSGTARKRTNEVETVDVFDIAPNVSRENLEKSFGLQLESVRKNVASNMANPFVNRVPSSRGLGARLEQIVAAAKKPAGTEGALSSVEASKRIRNLVGKLQWSASTMAGGVKGKAAQQDYWLGYARCLRACTLAQSIVAQVAVEAAHGGSSAEADEVQSLTREVRAAARNLREEMPSEVFDNSVLFGIHTLEEPWHTGRTIELGFDMDIAGNQSANSSDKSLAMHGRVTFVDGADGKKVDEFRPWATAKGRYVDILPEEGKVSDRLLEQIAKKALPQGASETEISNKKSEFGNMLANVGIEVEGYQSGGSRPSGEISLRLEYDADGKLIRFSASATDTKTDSVGKSKNHASVSVTWIGVNENELVGTFLKNSLSRVMRDAEELLKGTVSGEIPPALDKYAVRNSKTMVAFCNDLKTPDSESGKMLKKMEDLISLAKRHPRFVKFAESYGSRLEALKTALSSMDNRDDDWKLKTGTEFLALATQTMRLGSMYANDPWNDQDVFVV